ncbi:MAG: hypothetical protein IJA97_02970 [Clostridia bacterium]|nr:hypothetical protein [Clostridia bacterium]
MKKFTKFDIVISAIAVILVVAVATVFGALQISGAVNFKVNAFLLILTVLTLGIGLYTVIFALVRKGGYEYAVGGILFVAGIILLMVCLKLKPWLIVIIGVGIGIVAMIIPFILKASSLTVQRADEKPDFVPYTEKLKQQKEEEKEREEPLPEIKSFKD